MLVLCLTYVNILLEHKNEIENLSQPGKTVTELYEAASAAVLEKEKRIAFLSGSLSSNKEFLIELKRFVERIITQSNTRKLKF